MGTKDGGPRSGTAASEQWWGGERDAQLLELRAAGLVTRDIAARLGCSQGSVARRLKRHGTPMPANIKPHGAAVARPRLGQNKGPEPRAVTEHKMLVRANGEALPPSLERLLAETRAVPMPGQER